jgi:hypothetical protein
MKGLRLVVTACVALAVGSLGTWAATRPVEEPDSVWCEVSASSAASRGLSVGTFLDGTDSGCLPDELRLCVKHEPVLDINRC